MRVFGTTKTWVWWCIVALIVVTHSWLAMEPKKESSTEPRLDDLITLTYDFGTTDYEEFLDKLRNAVADTTKPCNLPSTRKNPSKDVAYVLVKLQVNSKVWVTFGVDAKDLYVWGYQDNVLYNKKYRANFATDTPTAAKNSLFSGSEIRFTCFKANYIDIERVSQTNRTAIPLIFDGLITDITKVHGKTKPLGTDEARLFLRVLVMVAEATRFKFIQEAIQNGDAQPSSEFRVKLLAYVNNWDKISQAIRKASPKCKAITPPLEIGNQPKVNDVSQIRDDMGLLMYG